MNILFPAVVSVFLIYKYGIAAKSSAVYSVICPLAVPLAVGAAWLGGSAAQKKADEALGEKNKRMTDWSKMISDFKSQQRQMHVIGGTQPIYQNWWDTKTGGYTGRG